MFDLDIVNSFSKATVSIIKNYSDTKISKGDIKIHKNSNHIAGVIVFLGITGDLNGRLMFNMSKETSLKLVSILNKEALNTIDDLFISTIKEFSNMVGGKAISDLSKRHIDLDITVPAILMSDQVFMLEKGGDEILSVEYKTDFGSIFMSLTLFQD